MIRLLLLLLLVLASGLFALWFQEQEGYLLLHVNGLSIQATLFVALLAVLLLVALGHLLLRFVARLVATPGGFRSWWQLRRRERNRARMMQGLRKLAEGEFVDAEKEMIRTAREGETPLLHYLGAALAAHRLGELSRRDQYLAFADQTAPGGRLAVGLIQAQLSVEDGQWETAYATLNLLQGHWPQHPRVLELLASVCRRIEDWSRLLELIPALRRSTALRPEEIDSLERDASAGLLRGAARQGRAALDQVWSGLSRQACRDPVVRLAHIDGLLFQDPGSVDAERLLRQGLQQTWSESWVQRYGRLRMPDPSATLKRLETWLEQRADDPALLLAAGRQALASAIWGRARAYLESAVKRGAGPEAGYLLGRLLEELGESAAAAVAYRQALEQKDPYATPGALSGLSQQVSRVRIQSSGAVSTVEAAHS